MKRALALLLAMCFLFGVLASCNAKTYTVTFETNGGTAVNALTLSAGETLTAPAAPTKEGYVFDGWYADASLSELYVFGEMPAKDITLYAKWKASGGASGENVYLAVEGFGIIEISLNAEEAPITVANFRDLVSSGFYDGLTFHRVIGRFVIQGGCPKGNGTGGHTDERGNEINIKGEFAMNGVDNDIKHVAGTISMARAGHPYEAYHNAGYIDIPFADREPYYNSASSQFFIVTETSQSNSASLDGNYAAFGQVTEGMDIVRAIAAVSTDSSDKPLTPVRIAVATFDRTEAEIALGMGPEKPNDSASGEPLLGDRVNGDWKNVDFKGQELTVAVSVNQHSGSSFPAADIYTKGPDAAGTNEVCKEVLARNAKAKTELGIDIRYAVRDLSAEYVHEDIRTITQTAAKNAPDIYNNDLHGLARAMVDGFLWNVKAPGDGVKNYLDLTKEGFYTEFMKGCTFDQGKLYLLAGDYFIDMVRMAWVTYVNNDVLMQNLAKMPTWCQSTAHFYEYVAEGFWDLDILADLSLRVFAESVYGDRGVTEASDTLVGLALSADASRILSAASGVTLYYQDKTGAPSIMASDADYQKVSDKYVSLLGTRGVYQSASLRESMDCFLAGNFLFAMGQIGERESAAMRNSRASLGIAPLPKWKESEQDTYHTVIDEYAEIGCILNTASAYCAASALLQYLNEESASVVYTYYEKGLKYKYNNEKDARTMMDLVRDTVDATSFAYAIGPICETYYTGVGTLSGLPLEKNTELGALFSAERDAYVYCLGIVLDKMANFN